ncbi:MAG: hypothetical protein M3R44_02635, partial [Candidatus Eremiobacteraeota bacterium]|nr:hypothetical protein [Candidatus Eremiobacteraeota bacterium]
GRSVRVYGVRGSHGGRASVTIDGRSYGTANFLAAKKTTHRLVFTSPVLRAGSHVISLTVLPASNGAGRGYVNIDGLEYQP